MSILVKGGWTMVAIGIALFVGLYFAIERFIYFKRVQSPTDNFIKRARAWLNEGDPEEAIKEIKDYDTPVSRVMIKGLMSGKSGAMDAQVSSELKKLESGLGVVASMGSIAPMLGFFGTVLGMIKAFMQIEILGGGVNPSRLAGGIWEALVTTAAGLAVGIIFLILYNSLSDRLNGIVNDMNRVKSELSMLMEE
ncbi:MAG: MotA/TolQ/ExbB proton channel family protein [candidate division WOR-3 bacterium]|nr:MotA/TolQ/ExbB proton channel family protein [candidate division WOR-3 bacterium]